MSPDEEWRRVPGFEGFYDVSSLGRVRRAHEAPACGSTKPGRVLKATVHNTGYVRLSLHAAGKCHRVLVHRIVARAFLPAAMARSHVNHLNGDKLDNRASNLEWATPQENTQHAWRTGLCQPITGERHGCAKLTEVEVARIRDAAARGVPQRSLASVFNVTEALISAIVRNRVWRRKAS